MNKQHLIFNGLLLCSCLSLTSSGCGSPPSVTSEEAPETTYSTPLDISIGYWNIEGMNDTPEDSLEAFVESRFNISIEPVSVSWTNYKDYYQMLAATNSLPDVFATLTVSSSNISDSAVYQQLIESGCVQPLPENLSAYPHLQKFMEEMDYTKYSDGRYYIIPRISFDDTSLSTSDAAMLVRRDWMETLGLENPTSLEDFIELISAFAKEDPDGNGVDDTIGYNVNNLVALGKWVILGIAPECNVYSWIDQNGTYRPSWYTEAFDSVVTAYEKIYHSGGLDPDFYTKNPSEVMYDFASGTLGALEYKSSPSSLTEIQHLWNQYNDQPFEECVDVLPIFPAPDGKCYSNCSISFWSESFISASVSEEKMERILALYDYLLTPEGIALGKYGLEGVDYTLSEKGDYTCLDDTSSSSLKEVLEKKYPSLTLFSGLATWGGTDEDFELSDFNFLRYGEWCTRLSRKDLLWNQENAIQVSRPESFLIFPKETPDEFSTTNAFNQFIKCIISSDDALSSWHDYTSQLKEDGIENYIQEQNRRFLDSQTS